MRHRDRGHPRRALRALALLATALCTGPAPAAETLVVDVPVLAAEPVMAGTRRAVEEGDCAPRRPGADAGLAAVLRWDLRADCRLVWRSHSEVAGWRVRYAWEGEVHEAVLDEAPGETMALRLTLH